VTEDANAGNANVGNANAGNANARNMDQLLDELKHRDATVRERARERLVAIGRPATPALIDLLTHEEQHVRWEAGKTLAGISDPAAAAPLSDALADDDPDVRWVAAMALIALNQEGVRAVLDHLIEVRDAPWSYAGAHHVLSHHCRNELEPILRPIVGALAQIDEPEAAVPIEAKKALDQLT